MILIMGAKKKALFKRLNRGLLLQKEKGLPISLIGSDFIKVYEGFPIYEGTSTFSSLKCFSLTNNKKKIIYLVSAWYHLPRCKLYLKRLGFKDINVRCSCSSLKIWETPLKTVVVEMRKYIKAYLYVLI